MGTRRAAGIVWVILAWGFLQAGTVDDDAKTIGRVRVATLHGTATARPVGERLSARYTAPTGKRFPDVRVISVRPRPGESARFDATLYDYAVQKAFDVVVDGDGRELSRRPLADQPARSLEELADARSVVSTNAAFAAAIAKGTLTLYEPMPAITVDGEGRRLVNVGVQSPSTAGASLQKNEIVSVDLASGLVIRYPSGAPPTSRAALLACGPPASGCSYDVGPCDFYQIVWPAAQPVWKLNIRHPYCTNSIQVEGTGLELTDVYYKGKLILKRAEVPVLNVVYANNVCGPYRDWLFSEDCFQATGTDLPQAGSGIRIASAPPSTICESGTPGTDAGNFKGVAIYDEGDALWLVTETNAGWYRYVMEWRLHLDGTIEPIFGFGATTNSCTCNLHYHHAYWRLLWAIDAVSDGTTDDPSTGVCTLERRRAGTQDEYDPIATEGTFVRPTTGADQDVWRIRNPQTGDGYLLEPGPLDGNANGDPYGQWDFAALALHAGEIDDPNSNTAINIAPWLNGESLGTDQRLVTWYHATFTHDDPNGTGEPCELSGPKLVPVVPCAGTITLNRSVYTCNAPVDVVMIDTDLAGHGSAIVTVTSERETQPDPLTLTETPAGSGRFQGTIVTTSAPPVKGDGLISVSDGDTIVVHYVDASYCGAPNVAVSKSVAVDCQAPQISGVTATPETDAVTISWTTSEPTGGIVHYGTTIPTGSTIGTTGTSTTHAVTIHGLAECSTYYFWLESSDAAGNVASSNSGSGYFAFRTARPHQVSATSTDTPVDIPDNDISGATSSIAIADPGKVLDVNVGIDISHTYDGDLTIGLLTPSLTFVTLAARRGGPGFNYYGTVFDDEAATPISGGAAPFTGTFRPETPLSAADGIPAAGSWTLRVVDGSALDIGTIDDWTLTLTVPEFTCGLTSTPPPVPDGSFGAMMTAPRSGTSPAGIHVQWDVSTCAATNYHLLYGSLSQVSSLAPIGAACGLGPLGSYDWAGVPADSIWFLVVGDDASSTEGTWGRDGAGVERNGSAASGFCGFTARSNAATCP